MSQISLADAARLYDCADQALLTSCPVHHDGFRRFCAALKNLEYRASDCGDDSLWAELRQRLRTIRFELTAAPLAFAEQPALGAGALAALRRHCNLMQTAYPDLVAPTEQVLAAVEELAQSHANPLADAMIELETRHEVASNAIVLKATRLIPAVEVAFAAHPVLARFALLGVAGLRGATTHDRMIIVGPARWYPDHVLTAPRAREAVVIRYAWIRDAWNLDPVFVNAPPALRNITRQREHLPAPLPEEFDLALDAADILPTIDWRAIASQGLHGGSPEAAPDDVQARLFLLEGDHAVFLEDDERTTTLIIDLEADSVHRVRRVPIGDLEPGSFVLLRTGAGGDFLVDLADQLLGERAAAARALQRSWKDHLRALARICGVFELAIRLLDNGSVRASEANVRRWLSERSIRTEDKRDFAAIMRSVGLADRIDEYWAAMEIIDSAHLRAGARLRRLLMTQILKSDLRPLEQLGRMDFALPEVDGGRLTAYRIVGVSPEATSVPSWRVAHPFALEAPAWPA